MSLTVKTKRRSSEKRKEKSRDAARCRRGQEAEIFKDLSSQLPVHLSQLSQLDKASIIRLSIAFIRLRQLFAEVDHSKENPANGIQQKIDQLFFRTLNGFMLLIEKLGEVVYVSENIEKYLGISQVDVLGQNIFEFLHPCDHEEFRDLLCDKSQQQGTAIEDTSPSFVRMKCTLTSKGHNINIKSASYKVIEVSGRIVQLNHSEDVSYAIVIGQPLPDLIHSELCIDHRMFVSRLCLDMRFTYCDNEVRNLLGYCPDNLIGNSVFKFHHAYDAEAIDKACKTLFMKGQSKTGLYRFLTKKGGYVWMETHATIVEEAMSDHLKYILCINYVVSGIECADQVFSDVQIVESQNAIDVVSTENVIEDDPDEVFVYEEEDDDDDGGGNVFNDTKHSRMQFVTEELLGIKVVPFPNTESVTCDLEIVNQETLVTRDLPNDSTELAGIQATKSMPLLDDSTLEELEMIENRAPYIPMDDMCFGSLSLSADKLATAGAVTFSSGSLNDDVDLLSLIKTYDHSTTEPEPIDSGVLICDAALSSAGPAVKRPVIEKEQLSVNSAAPSCKVMKLDHPISSAPTKVAAAPTTASNSSVLMNLLTSGIDTNYGYKLRDVYHPVNSEMSSSSSSDGDYYSSASCSPAAVQPTYLVQLFSPRAAPSDLSPELTYLADTGDVLFVASTAS